MSQSDNEQFNGLNITASAIIKPSKGAMGGIFCSANTGGAIAIYDGQDATGRKVIDTFTPVAGVNYAFPFMFQNGLFISITGGTGTSLTPFFT